MRLFRTINANLDPNQPFIQWDGDVRGIIAAMRARDAADRRRSPRFRLAPPPVVQSKALAPLEVAA
jgi:hypothetical protein